MIVGYEAGNDYDIGARLLAKYLAKHIPGQPTIIVQNMPQAASIVAANFLYARAPRDGTVLGVGLAQFPEPGGDGPSRMSRPIRAASSGSARPRFPDASAWPRPRRRSRLPTTCSRRS